MTLQVTNSWAEDDCVMCGMPGSTIPLYPEEKNHDYNKVCSDECYQNYGEAWEALKYGQS